MHGDHSGPMDYLVSSGLDDSSIPLLMFSIGIYMFTFLYLNFFLHAVIYFVHCALSLIILFYICLGLSINGLVTDENTKKCCRGFNILLFHSATANKIDSGKYLKL